MNPESIKSAGSMTFQQRKRLDEAFDKLSVDRKGVQCKKADIVDRCEDGPLLGLAERIPVMMAMQDGEPMVGKADWQFWADTLVKEYEPAMVDQVIAAFDVEPVGHVDGVRLVRSSRPNWDEEEMELIRCFDAFDLNHDGVLDGKEVVMMRDRDAQKFLTKHGLITQETADLVKTKKKTEKPFTRKRFLSFMAELGPEHDEEIQELIRDLKEQINFARGEMSPEELLQIGSSFGRLCLKEDDQRSSKILLSLWDPNEQAPIGAPVIAKTPSGEAKRRSKGKSKPEQFAQAHGICTFVYDDDSYQIQTPDGKFLEHDGLQRIPAADVTVYIQWEELMILAKQAKQADPEGFQRRLERMSRRSQGSHCDGDSNSSNPDAMHSMSARNLALDDSALGGAVVSSNPPPNRGTCRANCTAGCHVM